MMYKALPHPREQRATSWYWNEEIRNVDGATSLQTETRYAHCPLYRAVPQILAHAVAFDGGGMTKVLLGLKTPLFTSHAAALNSEKRVLTRKPYSLSVAGTVSRTARPTTGYGQVSASTIPTSESQLTIA